MPIDVALSAETRNALTVHRFEEARDLGVDAFVTDRFAGVSSPPFDALNLGDHVGDQADSVVENRRRVADAIGVDLARLVMVRQVHGGHVLDASMVTKESEADALYCDDDERALAILVADCVPLLIVDASSPRFALVHAGWRGLHTGVIKNALASFVDPSTLHAFIGPSISREAYQVGHDVSRHFSDVAGALTPDGERHARLDLRHVATHQLLTHGVRDEQIVRSKEVTDGGEVFFSDRAQRPCGRFALVAKRVS